MSGGERDARPSASARPSGDTDARRRILERVARATEGPEGPADPGHPGPLDTTADLDPAAARDPVGLFAERFREAGGEVVLLDGPEAAAEWLREFASEFATMAPALGLEAHQVPEGLRSATPRSAELGICRAECAVAETASLLLSARGGRRAQILPGTSLVWVERERVVPGLAEALEILGEAAGGAESFVLHSGPSKSADMAGHLVRGVHGPGRLVASVVG